MASKYDINLNVINENVTNNLGDFILASEQKYNNQITDIARHIKKLKSKIKFILVAGPSSAGKTTTSKLLCKALENEGYLAKTISIDDFFVNRDDTPLWPDGSKNYESVDSVDWKLFDKCIKELLNEKKSKLPTYNFKLGTKIFDKETDFQDGSIMIIEGLHALNPIIDNFIPKENCEKVYLSVRANVVQDGNKLIDGNNMRFVRRLIRDLYTRGASIEDTYRMWTYVRKGEELYIQPYKNTANFYVNTFHGYELGVYKYILNRLKKKGLNPESVNETLKDFVEVQKDLVPDTSLLQEFVH